MHGIERRFKNAWSTRIRAVSPPVRRETYWLRDGWRAFVGSGALRLFTWCAAMTPFPQSWHICAIIATIAALFAAAQLTQRGQAESILCLYGGSDRALLDPTRLRHQRRIIWGAVDALVILGAWWLQARIPGWAFLLGVPAYAAATGISPRVLVAIVPEALLTLIAQGAIFVGMLLAVLIGQTKVPGPFSESLFWVFGMASPSGWVVLMLHGLIEGKHLLWGIVPLLVASGVAARSFAKAQDHKLSEWVNGGAKEPEGQPASHGEYLENLGQDFATVTAFSPDTLNLGAILTESRGIGLLDLPRGKRQKRFGWKKAAWTAGILLSLAVLARPEFSTLGSYRMLAFGFGFVASFAAWLPVLGLPEWLWHARLSLNRVSSMFALFPVSLRSVIGLQMRSDLANTARALPGLTLLAFVSFEIAFSPPHIVALGAAFAFSLAVAFLLPLRWLRLTTWAQSNKPFRLARIAHGAFITVMACLFLIEAVFIIIAAFLAFGQMELSPDRYWMTAVPLLLGAFNATAGMVGIWFGLRAYERARYDLVNNPPKS